MSVAEFRQQVAAAIARHFPQAKCSLEERRGTEMRGRVQIDDTTLIDIYYSAATDKKSYALVRAGTRIFGYDNFRFWHCHPKDNPEGHVACQEPSLDQVFREIKEIYESLTVADSPTALGADG